MKSKNNTIEKDKKTIRQKIQEKEIVIKKENIAKKEAEVKREAIIKRKAVVKRKTKETNINLRLNLDGTGDSKINTGLSFFDHMLITLARFSLFNIELECKGDINVDSHHTIEDVGIAIGQAIKKALGLKNGINRFGQAMIPMDEALCICAIDFSGRPYLSFNAEFTRQDIKGFSTECIYDFFYSIAINAEITLQLKLLDGRNDHHKIEAMFKSFAKALRQACELDPRIKNMLPTTKGML